MSSSRDNNIYKKTSFLTGVNSSFIEKFYSDYLSNPEELPKDWKLFFDGLKDNEEIILKNLRGPSWSRAKKNYIGTKNIEKNLKEYLNVNKVIWLKSGTNEGTDGHVDNIACFVKPGVVMALSCKDKSDPFYEKINENLEILKTSTDNKGRLINVIELEMSYKRLIPNNDEPSSYINYYIANNGIVMPSYEDQKADLYAQSIIESAFPDRKIIAINGIDICMGGGNVHCITQQQPLSS